MFRSPILRQSAKFALVPKISRHIALLVLCTFSFVACDSSPADEPLRFVLEVDGRTVDSAEAREILGFDFSLPSYLPTGAREQPELVIGRSISDKPELRANYWEEQSIGRVPARVRFTFGREQLSLGLGAEQTKIANRDITMVKNASARNPELVAAWTDDEVGVLFEIAWISQTRASSLEISDFMKQEAIRVIDSTFR